MSRSLASTSSSNIDLDEGTSKHQDEQDSLNLPCQHVSHAAFDDDDDDPIFDLVPSRGEVADSGGELQDSFHPYHPQQPDQPSTSERELHNMTHIPSPPWCVVCQEAKGRLYQKKKQRTSAKTSKIQLAYAYVRKPENDEPTVILTWVESLTGLAGSIMSMNKGSTRNSLMLW